MVDSVTTFSETLFLKIFLIVKIKDFHGRWVKKIYIKPQQQQNPPVQKKNLHTVGLLLPTPVSFNLTAKLILMKHLCINCSRFTECFLSLIN